MLFYARESTDRGTGVGPEKSTRLKFDLAYHSLEFRKKIDRIFFYLIHLTPSLLLHDVKQHEQ